MVEKYLKTLECLEQYEPKLVHILLSNHKENCRHIATLSPLGAELFRGEKIFQNLECMVQFEPKLVHILLSTHKGNSRHIEILAPLGA